MEDARGRNPLTLKEGAQDAKADAFGNHRVP